MAAERVCLAIASSDLISFPLQAMGKHPNIVELLGQDKVDHVMVMEQGSTDLYKMVKKMNSEKGVPEHMMKAWALGICTGAKMPSRADRRLSPWQACASKFHSIQVPRFTHLYSPRVRPARLFPQVSRSCTTAASYTRISSPPTFSFLVIAR